MPKYKNKKWPCNQGHIHDSKAEASHCNALEWLYKAKEISGYETQVRFDLHGLQGKKIGSHIVDFLVIGPNNKKYVHEVKGRKNKKYQGSETALWRWKKKMFEQEYPDIEYNVCRY